MNALRKNNSSMIAILMAFVLISAALIGMAIIPGTDALQGDFDDPYPDHTLLEGVGIGTDWAYNTSTQIIPINYTLREKSITLYPEQVLVYTMVDTTEVVLYKWTPGDGPLADPFNWTMNLSAPAAYIITVEVIFYEQIDSDYRMDSMDIDFTVLDGTGAINSIIADPTTVTNSGHDDVQITLDLDRLFAELDMEETTPRFWNEDTQMWADIEMDPPEMGNITEVGHNVVGTTNLTIPMDFPVGEYKIKFHLVDLWGYEEDHNETLFTVIWKEMEPEQTMTDIDMDEDGFVVVDLSTYFMDKNGQTLEYYVNLSALDDLMIEWVDGMTINITAEMNFNGDESFEIWVDDGVANVSFMLDVTVAPMEDDLMESDDNTVLVNEHDVRATFDPTGFFYDPDDPVDVVVSTGWDWALNETNVSYMMPLWTYEAENFTVEINSTDLANSYAMITADLEEGRWMFPISAWIDDEFVMNGTAYVEIIPQNDVPMLNVDNVIVYKNELKTVNLSALFDDPDGPAFNVSLNTTVSGALLTYDWETFMLTINPATDWTGTIDLELNITDNLDYAIVTLPIVVMLRSYVVSGTVTLQAKEDLNISLANVTFMIGDNEVMINETTGAFEITLMEGNYTTVEISLPEMYTYSMEDERSGYMIPTFPYLNLTDAFTYTIQMDWKEYVSPVPTATWDDIDFENWDIEFEDDLVIVTVPVKNSSLEGYGDLVVILVIDFEDDEDVDLEFNMTWDDTEKMFTLELTEDEIENVTEGDMDFFFQDDGDKKSETFVDEFKKKDENANLITVIVLIVLIILVLIALVFIMRKPSEEEFDEDEEEEEEQDERTCSSCGETVTDAEAEECPYCGEGMEE